METGSLESVLQTNNERHFKDKSVTCAIEFL